MEPGGNSSGGVDWPSNVPKTIVPSGRMRSIVGTETGRMVFVQNSESGIRDEGSAKMIRRYSLALPAWRSGIKSSEMVGTVPRTRKQASSNPRMSVPWRSHTESELRNKMTSLSTDPEASPHSFLMLKLVACLVKWNTQHKKQVDHSVYAMVVHVVRHYCPRKNLEG